ncbi:MAG: hypothetical protein Q7R75_00685 [bacterium]|nr:hypothetical protein [bacterium]
MNGLRKKRELIFWFFVLAIVAVLIFFDTVKKENKSFQKQEEVYKACILDNFAMCILQNGKVADIEDARQCIRNLTTRRKWNGFEDICKSNAGFSR